VDLPQRTLSVIACLQQLLPGSPLFGSKRLSVLPELSSEAGVDKASRFSQGPLVQLGILGFGLLENGDIRVSVLPKSNEISIGGRGFGRVSGLGVGSSNLQVR